MSTANRSIRISRDLHRVVAKKKGSSGPREGYGYPVKPEWQEDVKKRLAKIGMTEKQLAKRIGCAQSTINDMLNKPGKQSALVPEIHAAIGWDPPPDVQTAPPIPSPDAIEMAHMFDRLPVELRTKLRDDARTYLALLARRGDGPRNEN